ncbi:MAG: DNA-protecting protein DprA [Silicimonas sp.]|nr:DNA-protecting protein DprA [Silicimonas sp.]
MAKDFSPSTHPLTPPLTEEEWLSWLRLLRSRRVGVATFFRLMNENGSAKTALEVLPQVAADAGVRNYEVFSEKAAVDEWSSAKRAGAQPLAFGAPGYPDLLAEIPDPPPFLWCIGNPDLLKKPMIALVGARNASSLGTRMSRKLAADLGEAGHIIVSGLARGVDAAAHLASLKTGTIAVMAGGVDVIYPAENAVLGQEIEENGLRLSECPMSLAPQARHFPRRNRIISGLARAVVVIEAAAKSGSLITARTALDQGREVFSVPGHPFDARASGCNMLIRDGSTLVRSSRDVIEALDSAGQPEQRRPDAKPTRALRPETATLHAQILDRLGPSPVPEDQLIRDLKLPAGTASPEIATLELEGKLRREPGGLLTRVD